MMRRITLLLFCLWAHYTYAQCPAGAAPTAYGNGNWIGYVFDGVQNFTNYQGSITENEIFDESFCGDNCYFNTSNCTVQTETFTIRFKMRKNFSRNVYRLIIGGDDGQRLSLDGGSTYFMNYWFNQGYVTRSELTVLDGNTDMVYDYYENDQGNRVSFSYVNLGPSWGGIVAGDQMFCAGGTVDPAAFTSTEPAMFVSSGTVQYQWESSPNNSTWTTIAGANGLTYDPPAGFTGVLYYRRVATNGTDVAISNSIAVRSQQATADQSTYGNGSWVGYVYDGVDNFSTNFMGSITQPTRFDENFGGDTNTFPTSGCDVYAETFTVRFKMRINLPCGDYQFVIGGDDGVRLSIDGGATYLINDYWNHGYNTVTHSGTVRLSGTYDLILDYYEDGGGNRVSFNYTTTACPLPVKLTSFTGDARGNASVLRWATATELNNKGFVVERGSSGVDYDSIGFVAGNGTSAAVRRYAYTDVAPPAGRNYYRLRQVDFDGRYDYSRIVMVEHDMAARIGVYPNPAHDYVTVESRDEVVGYRLLHAVGGRDVNFTTQGNRLYFAGLAPGVYVLVVQTVREVVYTNLVVR